MKKFKYRVWYQLELSADHSVEVTLFVDDNYGRNLVEQHEAHFDRKEDAKPMLWRFVNEGVDFDFTVNLDSFV